nr:hypothetical protein [uncultured Prevotella sp.]
MANDGVFTGCKINGCFIIASIRIGKIGLAILEIWHGDTFRPRF